MKHPMQKLHTDDYGVVRFVSNPIVRYLLDNGPFDMNYLALAGDSRGWSKADYEQFAQLIGYSVSGFSELSYVRDKTYEKARRRYDAHYYEKENS